MNIWLHKQVMQKLAENGGKVPEELRKKGQPAPEPGACLWHRERLRLSCGRGMARLRRGFLRMEDQRGSTG